MPDSVRVRFAPSPTGSMHVGNVRTAIYNWLFARANHGEFLLRIEDTDPERSKPEWVAVILDGLRWLGLDWDNEPVFQSQRMGVYRELAAKMLADGIAYRCFCSPEELEARRKAAGKSELAFRYDGHCRSLTPEQIEAREGDPFAIRLWSDSRPISYVDGVHGQIEVSGNELDDIIIMRQNHTPTYNFAVVVDDREMAISHVFRGDDHISNTPKQIQIYRALGWDHPRFAHLPLILGPDRKPLSKRHGAVSLGELRDQKILPQALLNYLALLGWSPGDDREVMTKTEMVAAFTLENISASSAIFDPDKLQWMNGQHLSAMSSEEIYGYIHISEEKELGFSPSKDKWISAINLLKTRPGLLLNISTQARYVFQDPETYDSEGVAKYWKAPETSSRLSRLAEILATVEPFVESKIEVEMRSLAQNLEISASILIHPTRLALTGTTFSPGLFELMAHLGKDIVLRRLINATRFLADHQS
jgi:nondiscriminating glutamyl-tRNA synthetase